MRHRTAVGFVICLLFALALAPHAAAQSGGGKGKISVAMFNTGVDPNAIGKVIFEAKTQKQLFSVKTKKLDPGDYTIFVGSVPIGTFNVSGSEPAPATHKLTLDSKKDGPFPDPRGQIVRVTSGVIIFLTTNFPNNQSEVNNIRISSTFQNTGVEPSAAGTATLRVNNGRARFHVDLTNLQADAYELRVGGVVVDTFTVSDQGGNMGNTTLDFSNLPGDSGETLMTFDPRGQVIEVVHNGQVVLTTNFPTGPTT
jgi:hypothetical protein